MGKVKKKKQPVRIVSWEEYQTMVDKLAAMLCSSEMLFQMPQMFLWGIPRGGTIVAISISHFNEQLFGYWKENPLTYGNCSDLVIVDDIVDSGDTATPYHKKFPVASLFVRGFSSFEPDWYVEKLEDNTWIKFPWEKNT